MQYPSRMLVSALVALSSLPVLAQENANTGKLLYDDTAANSSSLNNVGSTCAQCHDITSRRAQLAGSRNSPGSPYANIEFDQAMARFQQAVQSQSGMTIFGNLTSQEARDIGAYLSDTPKTSPSVVTGLSFSASAVNQATAAQNVDLSNSVVTGSPSLVISAVSISGANAARFTLTQDICTSQTLAAAASCRVSVRYTPDRHLARQRPAHADDAPRHVAHLHPRVAAQRQRGHHAAARHRWRRFRWWCAGPGLARSPRAGHHRHRSRPPRDLDASA